MNQRQEDEMDWKHDGKGEETYYFIGEVTADELVKPYEKRIAALEAELEHYKRQYRNMRPYD